MTGGSIPECFDCCCDKDGRSESLDIVSALESGYCEALSLSDDLEDLKWEKKPDLDVLSSSRLWYF